MKTFEVDVGGKTYEVDAPDANTAWQWANATHQKSIGKGESFVYGLAKGTQNVVGNLQEWLGKGLEAAGAEETGKAIQEDIRKRREQFGKEYELRRQANPISAGAGELTSEIATTLPVGGIIGKPLMAAGRGVATAAPRVGQSLEATGRAVQSAGFDVAPATTILGRAGNAALRVGGGAITGGASAGLINPENVAEGVVAGGIFGALAKPIGEALGGAARRFATDVTPEARSYADTVLFDVAKEMKTPVKQLPQDMTDWITAEALKAFKEGKKIDAAAMIRKAEFEKLGIKPLLGQVTRNPSQFAQERNLRGASPAIAQRLEEQNMRLQGIFDVPAAGATEPYQAGNLIKNALQQSDDAAKEQISRLYQAARDSQGRYAEVNHLAFVQNANKVLDEQMLGRFLPDQARGLLNDIASGKVPLNVNNLVQVDSVLSAAQRAADDAGAKAIGVIRDALHEAPIASNAGTEAKQAFDIARGAARERFKGFETNPALKAVVEGKASADDFVSKYIIRGKTDDVKQLANALRNSPDVLAQAKSQIAADIRRAAFGENITADTAIRPELLARKIREIGSEKMAAFFTPEEIARYNTAVKVANYIEKHPNAAPVNTSNTLVSALMQSPMVQMIGGAASKIPGAEAMIGAAKASTTAVKNQMATSQAMKAEIPTTALELSPEQRKLLSKVLGGAGAAVGAFSQ